MAGVPRDPTGVPPAVADIGGYRFMESPDPEQEMVAYDPCRPVRVVVRPDHAPPDGQQLIEEAIGAVSAATGLQFVDAGTTTEAPSSRREPYQPDRYGRQWAPVLIAWSDVGEYPDLAGDVAGRGGSTAQNVDEDPFVYVTGQVVLGAPSLTSMMERPDQVRAVIMHELAHVVGLAHVDDPGQLMYGDNAGLTDFAPGDHAGFAKLGARMCVPGCEASARSWSSACPPPGGGTAGMGASSRRVPTPGSPRPSPGGRAQGEPRCRSRCEEWAHLRGGSSNSAPMRTWHRMQNVHLGSVQKESRAAAGNHQEQTVSFCEFLTKPWGALKKSPFPLRRERTAHVDDQRLRGAFLANCRAMTWVSPPHTVPGRGVLARRHELGKAPGQAHFRPELSLPGESPSAPLHKQPRPGTEAHCWAGTEAETRP